MVKLYVRDNVTGEVHEYGTNQYDSLVIGEGGSLHYVNRRNHRNTEYQDEGYTFVYKNGLDPRESVMVRKYGEDPVLDVGGMHNPIENIEVVRDLSWMQKVADDVAPSRGETVFGDN